MYIWQHAAWPNFIWHQDRIESQLAAIRLLQGRLLGRLEAAPESTDVEMEMDALIQSAIRTSEIEGEHLDAQSVRSSIVQKLGLQRAGLAAPVTAQSEALVELLVEATREPDESLSLDDLCRWQSLLFPEHPGLLSNLRIGKLRGAEPMRVVSGRIDRPTVHFEAPPRDRLDEELARFIAWFRQPQGTLDPLLRAGIAHLWLITLHPFEDGNGRVARAVTDRALAQAERQSVRFYSLSEAIMLRRKSYYQVLESTQRGNLDITDWLQWFLDTLEQALEQAMVRLRRVLSKARFWQKHAPTPLSERQIKALNRLVDTAGEGFRDGITARKYGSLTKVSKATATRDLTDLFEKGCLEKLPGRGRSTRYVIAGQKDLPPL